LLLSSVSSFASTAKPVKTNGIAPIKNDSRQPKADALKSNEKIQRDVKSQQNLETNLKFMGLVKILNRLN